MNFAQPQALDNVQRNCTKNCNVATKIKQTYASIEGVYRVITYLKAVIVPFNFTDFILFIFLIGT